MVSLVKFLLLIILEIPAVLMSISIIIYFILNRSVRLKFKNHIWLVLVILNISQLLLLLPLPIRYYQWDHVWLETASFCTWWSWFEYSTNTASLILMAWASIERHLMIFYFSIFLRLKWKRWAFHYLPILFCLLWTPSFYFVLIVISPNCNTIWNYDQVVCGAPCFITTARSTYGLFDFLFNITVPLMVMISANLILIIRVIYGKLTRQQAVRWRRHRKMTVQLWLVSSLYFAGWLPFTVTRLVQLTFAPWFFLDVFETIVFILYFVPLLLPFFCLTMLPGLMKKIQTKFFSQRQNQIAMVID